MKKKSKLKKVIDYFLPKNTVEIPRTLKDAKDKEIKRHKPFYKSKTFWFNIVLAGSLLFETTQEYLSANPDQAIYIAVAGILLRFMTTTSLTWRDIQGFDEEIVYPSPPKKPSQPQDK